jgi:hypothetical protein
MTEHEHKRARIHSNFSYKFFEMPREMPTILKKCPKFGPKMIKILRAKLKRTVNREYCGALVLKNNGEFELMKDIVIRGQETEEENRGTCALYDTGCEYIWHTHFYNAAYIPSNYDIVLLLSFVNLKKHFIFTKYGFWILEKLPTFYNIWKDELLKILDPTHIYNFDKDLKRMLKEHLKQINYYYMKDVLGINDPTIKINKFTTFINNAYMERGMLKLTFVGWEEYNRNHGTTLNFRGH